MRTDQVIVVVRSKVRERVGYDVKDDRSEVIFDRAKLSTLLSVLNIIASL